MAKVSAALRQLVVSRANRCCEYCQMSQADDPAPFHIDHIRPKKHDGPNSSHNLALSCAACSQYKGSNVAGFDPETGILSPLFDPRTQKWSEHFRWQDGTLIGLSAIGNATIQVFRINTARRIARRCVLIELGRFPPKVI